MLRFAVVVGCCWLLLRLVLVHARVFFPSLSSAVLSSVTCVVLVLLPFASVVVRW